jgi:hypothetical protein
MKKLIFLILFVGCAEIPKVTPTEPQKSERVALYWENTTEAHPERMPWSDALTGLISKNLSEYSQAKDIESFCPKFKSLSDSLKIKAIGEIYVATAYYESGFNPKSRMMEGAPVHNWSEGLYQLTVPEGGLNKVTILEPIPNIIAAETIMRKLLKSKGVLAVTYPGCYWSVLSPNHKHSKLSMIKERVKKHAIGCI